MRIIIIGASGLIGQNLYTIAKEQNLNVIGTSNNQKVDGLVHFDMISASLPSIINDLCRDDVVYILSAYSNPSWIFENQAKAKALNLAATKQLIDEAFSVNARIIFMSSVEVFDGLKGEYDEESIPNPLNMYGQMKFEIEKYLNEKRGRYCIVRTGWNVGWDISHRCPIKLTYQTLLGPDAKMAKDNIFSIIDVSDTAKGLLHIANMPALKICHLAAAPPVVRIDLARSIKKLSKYKDLMNYRVVSFSDIAYSEPRARYNQLNNSLARELWHMSFRPSGEIIEQKVKLLDDNIEHI